MKRLFALFVMIITVSGILWRTPFVFGESKPFVRTANYFLLSGPELDKPETLKTLSQFQLIVLPLEAQVYNPTAFQTLRTLNKDIIILAYVPTVSWNDVYWIDPLHKRMYQDIQSSWWLKNGSGGGVSVWPNTRALNLNSGWSDYLAQYTQSTVMASGYWDGIFYDEVQDSISWVGSTDVNRDGKADQATEADRLWAQNYQTLFKKTREAIGPKAILITNGSSNPAFAPYVNGRMFESFPSSTNTLSEWKQSTQDYLAQESKTLSPNVNIINANSGNTGIKNNYQQVRFGLTTTLLGNGYFGFDFGTENHAQLWQYDEYNASLGAPKSVFTHVFETLKKTIDIGVWQRDFEQGRVLVNATNQSVIVPLDGEFEKLHGTQDPRINNGAIVSEITLAAKDGIILLRPIERLENTPFRNGAFARIFEANGATKRTGFFTYDSAYRGGIQILYQDIDQSGRKSTIVADPTYVSVYSPDQQLLTRFAPYGESYKNGINIAVGSLEKNGPIRIVTGTLRSQPIVKIYSLTGEEIHKGFSAYDKAFMGGVNIALADINGDGSHQIVTAPAASGGAHIKFFASSGKLLTPGFFAYPKTQKTGAYVAAGDANGDGKDEIITGSGIGGTPEIRLFDKTGKSYGAFFATDKNKKTGIKIAATDLDGDGLAEIIALTTDVFTLSTSR